MGLQPVQRRTVLRRAKKVRKSANKLHINIHLKCWCYVFASLTSVFFSDWYPEQVKVQHDGIDISVTFNLAPEELGISSYFSLCYTSGMKTYTDIKPVGGVNFVASVFN